MPSSEWSPFVTSASTGALRTAISWTLLTILSLVAICTASASKDKMVSNVHEIAVRNAPVLALVTKGDHSLDGIAADVFEMPEAEESMSAILNTVMLQPVSYTHLTLPTNREV